MENDVVKDKRQKTKAKRNSKSQILMTKTIGLGFGIWSLFVIWNLGFGICYAAAKYTPNVSQKTRWTDGLVGYWTFDGPDMDWDEEDAVRDQSGQGNHGAVMDGAPISGKVGQAFAFDGSSGILIGNENSSLRFTGNGTISAWIWLDPGGIVFTKQDDQSPNYEWGMKLWVNPDGVGFGVVHTEGGTHQHTTLLDYAFDENTWYHVAAVWDSPNTYIYINGNSEKTEDIGSGTLRTGANMWSVIGACFDDGDPEYFGGVLDEVRIYDRALSPAEIQEMYNAGAGRHAKVDTSQKNKLTSGLVGYWTFDGADMGAYTAHDSSGLGNNGTLGGSLENPAFVQIATNGGSDITTLGATFASTGTSGNLIVVGVLTNDDNAYVTDDKGNSYTRIIGIWHSPSEQLYYAKNITGGGSPITVTAHFSGLTYSELYIAEYSGIDTVSPLYKASFGIGETSGTAETSSVEIGDENVLITGYCSSGSCSEGTGFTPRSRFMSNVFEDRIVSTIGSYKATGEANQGWTILMAAFKAKATSATPVTVAGKVGQALSFDGVDDYVSLGTFNFGNITTISMWANINSGETYSQTLIANGAGGWQSNGFRIFINDWETSNQQIIIETGNGSGGDAAYSAVGVFTYPGWHHVAVILDRTNGLANVYMDSVQVITNGNILTDYGNNQTTNIGQFTDNNAQFGGLIDEVRIYDRALSPAEIQELYNMGQRKSRPQI